MCRLHKLKISNSKTLWRIQHCNTSLLLMFTKSSDKSLHMCVCCCIKLSAKMSFAGNENISPLINCITYDSLLQATPHVNQTHALCTLHFFSFSFYLFIFYHRHLCHVNTWQLIDCWLFDLLYHYMYQCLGFVIMEDRNFNRGFPSYVRCSI